MAWMGVASGVVSKCHCPYEVKGFVRTLLTRAPSSNQSVRGTISVGMRCHVVNLLPAPRELQARLPDRGQTERTGLLISTRTMVVMVVMVVCGNQTDAGRCLAAVGGQLGSGTVWLSANRETAVTLVTSLLWVLTITGHRASTCARVGATTYECGGLCMNPIYARWGGLLQPESAACESTSLSGSRAEIRPDSSLILLRRCCAEATAPKQRTSPSSGLEQPGSRKHYGLWRVF